MKTKTPRAEKKTADTTKSRTAMHFRMARWQLSSMLRHLEPIIRAKPPKLSPDGERQVLLDHCIAINAKGDAVEISAVQDGTTVRISELATVSAMGRAVVEFATLCRFVEAGWGAHDEIEIKLVSGKLAANVHSRNATLTVPVHAMDFPTADDRGVKRETILPTSLVLEAFRKVLFAVPKDGQHFRYDLHSIALETKDGVFNAVGTDCHREAVFEAPCSKAINALVPRDMARLALDIVPHWIGHVTCHLSANESCVGLHFTDGISSIVIEREGTLGVYPPWRDVVAYASKDCDGTFKVDRLSLLVAMKHVASVMADRVRLLFSNSALNIEAAGSNGNVTVSVAIQANETDHDIDPFFANCDYIRDFLKFATASEVTIAVPQDDRHPMLFTCGDLKYILMLMGNSVGCANDQ